MGDVLPFPAAGTVLPDARGEARVLRVNWHAAEDVVVLSTWRAEQCVATVRLAPAAAAALVAALADGLAAR